MFYCKECGNEFIKWQGQCSFCKSWGSLTEVKEEKKSAK
jgi:DNA repair protein RadA/Sms